MKKPPLRNHKIAAQSGNSQSALIFIHGYGANGDDLLSLSNEISSQLPNTSFYAPDASFSFAEMANAFRWFSVPWLDGCSNEKMQKELELSIDYLVKFIDYIHETEHIPYDKIALFGFSQGAALALYIGTRRVEPIAAIVGFSGLLLELDEAPTPLKTTPPIFISHGTKDEVVDFSNLQATKNALTAQGVKDIETYIMQDAGHTISLLALARAQNFLRNHLRAAP